MTLHLDLLTAECGNVFVTGEVALPKVQPAPEQRATDRRSQAEAAPVIEAPAGVWGY